MTITHNDVEKLAKTPLGKEIVELLTPIWNDDEFIVSALVYCKTQEQRQKLINIVKKRKLDKYEDIVETFYKINIGQI